MNTQTKLTNQKQSPERLQKYLASQGFGSRRYIEDEILKGSVTVNGKKAILGQKVDPLHDEVFFHKKKVERPSQDFEDQTYCLYKPEGYLTSFPDENEMQKTIYDLPSVHKVLSKIHPKRLLYCGRLDLNSSGLLILTTSGELVQKITHPRNKVEKKYIVGVMRALTKRDFEQLKKGILLEDETRPAHVSKVNKINSPERSSTLNWYELSIQEGRKRVIRRIFDSLNNPVSKLLRVQVGNFPLPSNLKIGEMQILGKTEILRILG